MNDETRNEASAISPAVTDFGDHYSTCAAEYAAYRPTYPQGLIDQISDLCVERELAWDVGTGNGQAAVLLAARFGQVVATDASSGQIHHARPHPRVTYRVATADDSGLPSTSADLITVAQALHWLDLTQFYAEVRRVLKVQGILAVWCYGRMKVDSAVDSIITAFYSHRVGRYWPPQRRHVETGYRDLAFPPHEIPQREPWAIKARLTIGQTLDYIATWSAVQRARKAEGTDPMTELQTRLRSVWPDERERRTVTWPITLRVARMHAGS